VDAGAAEVDERDQRLRAVEPEAAVADEADAAVESFESAVVEAEPDRVEDPGPVAADRAGELDEWLESGPGCPAEPGVEVLGRERGVVEVVEEPELFLEQERAVERPVGLLDFAELRELIDRLLLWRTSAATSAFP
jgi:hypothetical protein